MATSPRMPTEGNRPMPGLGGAEEPGAGSARGRFLALAAALLGWMFDGAEMGLFSLVGRPAVQDLLSKELAGLAPAQRESVTGLWFSVIIAGFLVGAATGGVVFGWLGDRLGRVKAMALSVLTYALFTGFCGLATAPWQVLVLRFVASLGMGGEWSLGVALVMEVWPNRSRAFMAGLIGAAANVGYLLVGVVGIGLLSILGEMSDFLSALGLSEGMVARLTDPVAKGWRLMMILGAVPALLTFFIRLFVPESHKWQQERARGATGQWVTRDLLAVAAGVAGPAVAIYLFALPRTVFGGWTLEHTWDVRAGAAVLGLLVAMTAFLYPVFGYLRREARLTGRASEAGRVLARMVLGAALSGIPLLGTWGAAQWGPAWADQLARQELPSAKPQPSIWMAWGATDPQAYAKEYMQIWMAFGAIVGTLFAAMLGDRLGRRPAYFLLCVAAMISAIVMFQTNSRFGDGLLFWGFMAGVCTASFYGWLPLYLPELYRTAVRATGQGFSFNFGRILAAMGTLQVGAILKQVEGGYTLKLANSTLSFAGGYPLACSAVTTIYLAGMLLIWLAPETRGKLLPE